MSARDVGFALALFPVFLYVGGFVNAWYVSATLRHRGYDAHLVCAGLLPTWGVTDATVWRDPRFTELLLQALAGQAFAVTITWIAVALSLWSAMSAGAVVAGSLSCLVSIPLYYVLERKLVKG